MAQIWYKSFMRIYAIVQNKEYELDSTKIELIDRNGWVTFRIRKDDGSHKDYSWEKQMNPAILPLKNGGTLYALTLDFRVT